MQSLTGIVNVSLRISSCCISCMQYGHFSEINSLLSYIFSPQAYREANFMVPREHNLKRSSSFFRGSTGTLLSTPSSSQSQLFHVASSAQMLHQVNTSIPEHSEVHSVSETIPAASEANPSDAGFFCGTDKSRSS